MTQETLVAVFDTAAHADAACADLENSGIPASDIERHASQAKIGAVGTEGAMSEPRKGGFWASLFGGETSQEQNIVYDRTVQSGGEVVTVLVRDVERDADRIMDIVEKYGPIDVSERAASYGLTGAAATTTGVAAAMPTAAAASSTEQTIQLAEETLSVGKRAVSRGTTRLHRFVSSRAVEENVTLRDETVSIERRPVTGTVVAPDAFTDKTIEMTETDEEAVVAKTARVREEVVLHKDVTDRVETIRDTLRSEELEVEKIPGTVATETTTVRATTVPGAGLQAPPPKPIV